MTKNRLVTRNYDDCGEIRIGQNNLPVRVTVLANEENVRGRQPSKIQDRSQAGIRLSNRFACRPPLDSNGQKFPPSQVL
jgi:hypothetical protein